MNENQRDPIFLALRDLYESGDLTGLTPSLRYKGEQIITEADLVVDDVVDDGWTEGDISKERSEWGGVMVRDVEDVRAKKLAEATTEEEIAAAKALPQYFVREQDIDDQTPARLEYQARENFNYIGMNRIFSSMPPRSVALMQEFSPRYLDKVTKEPEWRYNVPANQLDYVRPRPLRWIANHRVCNGDWSVEQLGRWAESWYLLKLAGRLGPEVI